MEDGSVEWVAWRGGLGIRVKAGGDRGLCIGRSQRQS